MGEFVQEQLCFATIDCHQFREFEVWREPNFMRLLPTGDFIKETRQMVNIPIRVIFGFTWPQQRAMLRWQLQTVNCAKYPGPHFDFSSLPVSDR
jgi:hypothetical protein